MQGLYVRYQQYLLAKQCLSNCTSLLRWYGTSVNIDLETSTL